MGPRHPLITVAAVQLAAILEEVFVQQRQERSDTMVSRVCNHSLKAQRRRVGKQARILASRKVGRGRKLHP